MAPKKVSVGKHLTLAKHDIARGIASFRSAANHIASAIEDGATQTEAAVKVGKSQPWVNRLLKWRENGFKGDSPFADDHARAIISAANNPPEPETRSLSVQMTHKNVRLVAPYTRVEVPEPEPEVLRLQITKEPPKAPADYSEEVAAAAPLLGKLARLEQAVSDLKTEIELHGGIEGAGEDARCCDLEGGANVVGVS